jgi:hypothetical protein
LNRRSQACAVLTVTGIRVARKDPAGYLQMPGFRCLAGAANGKRWDYANKPSAAMPESLCETRQTADSGGPQPSGCFSVLTTAAG